MTDPSPTPRSYGGLSAADRLAQRRRRLLDAGLQVIGTKGIAATTIADVCAEAGLIKRYFYESFASVDELAIAVFDDVTGALVDQVAAAIAAGNADPRPVLEIYIRALLGDPRVARLLGPESLSAPLAERRARFGERAVGLWFGDAGAPDERMRLRALGFAGAISEVTLAWTEGRLDLPIEDVIDELVALAPRGRGRR